MPQRLPTPTPEPALKEWLWDEGKGDTEGSPGILTFGQIPSLSLPLLERQLRAAVCPCSE